MSLHFSILHHPDYQPTFGYELLVNGKFFEGDIDEKISETKGECLCTTYTIKLSELKEDDYRCPHVSTMRLYTEENVVHRSVYPHHDPRPTLTITSDEIVLEHVKNRVLNEEVEMEDLSMTHCRHLVLKHGSVDPFEWVDPANLESIKITAPVATLGGDLEDILYQMEWGCDSLFDSVLPYFEGKEGQFTSLDSISVDTVECAKELMKTINKTSISTLSIAANLGPPGDLEGLDIDVLEIPRSLNPDGLKASRIGTTILRESKYNSTAKGILCTKTEYRDGDFYAEPVDLRTFENRKRVELHYDLTLQLEETEFTEALFVLRLITLSKPRKSARSDKLSVDS